MHIGQEHRQQIDAIAGAEAPDQLALQVFGQVKPGTNAPRCGRPARPPGRRRTQRRRSARPAGCPGESRFRQSRAAKMAPSTSADRHQGDAADQRAKIDAAGAGPGTEKGVIIERNHGGEIRSTAGDATHNRAKSACCSARSKRRQSPRQADLPRAWRSGHKSGDREARQPPPWRANRLRNAASGAWGQVRIRRAAAFSTVKRK